MLPHISHVRATNLVLLETPCPVILKLNLAHMVELIHNRGRKVKIELLHSHYAY